MLRILPQQLHGYGGALLSVFVLCVTAPFSLAQVIVDVEESTPRDFGYTIGDRFEHTMRVVLRDPQVLSESTLPALGSVDRWLEIASTDMSITVEGDLTEYFITVEYQILNAPRETSSVTTPQLEFLTTGGVQSIPIFLAEWTFSISPVANISDATDSLHLQPDLAPGSITNTPRWWRLLFATASLVGLALWFAYRRWWRLWLQAERYPFRQAIRHARAVQSTNADDDDYRTALKAFHAAVNATAGQVVFEDDLDTLFATYPQLATHQERIEAVYAESRDVFFNAANIRQPAQQIDELLLLCRDCHALERQHA